MKRIPNYPQQPDAWWSLPDDPQTLRAGLTGMSGSFVLHGVTLLALSLLVLEQWHDPAPLSTEWTQSDEGPPSLPESAAGVLELESVVIRNTDRRKSTRRSWKAENMFLRRLFRM